MKQIENIEKHLNEYTEKGYTIVPKLIPQRQIQKIFNQIESILDYVIDFHRINISHTGGIDGKYMALKQQNPKICSHVYDILKVLNSIAETISSSKITKILEKILGTTIIFSDDSQIRIDDNTDDRLIEFHQEVGLISTKNATLWCPLVDLNKKMNGLKLIPGSHKNGFVPHRFFTEQHNYYCIMEDYQLDKSKTVSPICKAGDGVIFDGFLIHGSKPNQSKNLRWTLISRFNSLKGTPYLKEKDAKMHIPYTADYNSLKNS
tara:strand:+ start:1417 stop:2202 length:786 start_codon:yes stop_codon:yes gene_type:complete